MAYPKHPNTDLVIQLYKDGVPHEKLREIANCPKSTVARILKKNGLTRRIVYKQKVIALSLAGHGHREIADMLGAKISCVREIRRQIGMANPRLV